MTRNGHHIIQKRDLLEMLRGVPECEHIAVQVDGPTNDEPGMPVELPALAKAKEAYEHCGGTPEAKAYIELLEARVEELETAFPEEEERRTNFMAIDSIHRSHSVTHLVCGI